MSKRGAGPSDFLEGKRARTLSSIDKLYEAITVDQDDKKASKQLVDETLSKIIGHIRNEQRNGKLYDHRIVKAGSYAYNAKIGKADEFDFNVPLNINNFTLRTEEDEGIDYTYIDSENTNMTQKLLLTSIGLMDLTSIPKGYAIVEISEDQDVEIKMFKHFLSTSEQINSTRRGLTELIPRDIKQDFHSKLRVAIDALELHSKAKKKIGSFPVSLKKKKRVDVKLDENANGPALTLTLSRGNDVEHKIDVDLTLSLKIPLSVTQFGWPRKETRRAFSEEQIENVLEAGIHLVPKKNLFWAISFSRAERALLSGIDADNACRKMTLKILKYLLERCKSRSASKLHGMSSHILKTQVLWSCEIHADEQNYWSRGNRDQCLVNTMDELADSLRSRNLPDYFNRSINVIERKDVTVLNELANFMSQYFQTSKGHND